MNNLRCPKCGVEYPEEADRCINCGNPINGNVEGKVVPDQKLDIEFQKRKSYITSKLLGLFGIIFFLPLAIISGFYLVTRKEKDAKYWGVGFLVISLALLVFALITFYTMGYDKFMATYNLTNITENLTNSSFKL